MSTLRPKKRRKGRNELGVMAGPKGEEIGEDTAITNSLGDDTLLNILQRIQSRVLLSVVSLVCRRWRRLCQENLVRAFEFTSPFSDKDLQILSILRVRFPFLRGGKWLLHMARYNLCIVMTVM